MNSELSKNELRRLDITLLLVFLGLLKHRKAIHVADELGLSPSGVSQALGRLRDIFGDVLFLRIPHGLEPTALALSLETPLAEAVEILRTSLGEAVKFSPLEATGTIRIGANDAEQVVIIPEFGKRLYEAAPGLKLEIVECDPHDANEMLSKGTIDLAILTNLGTDEHIREAILYEEDWLAVCQKDIMVGPDTIHPEKYAHIPHVAIGGKQATAFASKNSNHCIALTVPSYLSALTIVAQAGCIAIVPARLGALFAQSFGLATARVSDAPAPYKVCTLWHVRNERDARLKWVREQIEFAAGIGSNT